MATRGDTVAHERAPATRPAIIRPRRWPRRALIGANLAVAAVVLAAGLGYAYVKVRLGEINTVSIPGLTPATSGPSNILIVGSDTRSGLTDPNARSAFGAGTNATGGQRSDVTMVLHLDPSTNQASVLSIPRDLYVPIAGANRSDRINSSFGNGPQQLIQTIQNDLHIPINHFVQMNFDGFQGLVNAVGGIDVNFPYPAKDAFSGLNITATGCQHLNGAAALSLARSRDYQYHENGSWRSDGEGDLGRIRRQHTFIRILMSKAISAGIRNPITANSLISNAVHDVTIDDKLGTNDILGLVLRFRSLNPSSFPTYTMPVAPAVIGGADVLRLEQPAGQQTIDQFLHPPKPSAPAGAPAPAPPPVAPSSVKVQVLNGSGTAGQAAQAAGQLRSAGFVVTGTGDAPGPKSTSSRVLYAPGKQQAAQLLQGRVGGGAGIQQDPALQGADVALVTGTSYSGITSAAAPAPAAPAPAPAALPPFDPRAC